MGIETPRLAKIMVKTSMGEFCQYAAMTPRIIPNTVAITSEVRASSIVTGRRSVSISVTGRPKRIESPRSPVTTRLI